MDCNWGIKPSITKKSVLHQPYDTDQHLQKYCSDMYHANTYHTQRMLLQKCTVKLTLEEFFKTIITGPVIICEGRGIHALVII
jgi:hypothetical protein